MKRILPAIALLVLQFTLLAKEDARYIITVNNIETYASPDRTAPLVISSLKFGSIITPERTILNDYDYNYLEILHEGKLMYLPQEMCVLLENDAEDTVLRYESQKAYPAHYIPDELSAFDKIYTYSHREIYVRHEMHSDLARLVEKGQRDGFTLKVAGGYANLEERITEYELAIKDDPKQSYVKPPLESEYGSGLVVDFTDDLVGPNFKKYFQTYKLWQWLSDNAAEYNFVPTDSPYKFLYTAPTIAEEGSISWKYRIVQIMDRYRLRLYHGKPSQYYSFLWIHNNEISAGRTLSYAHEKYGANSVSLINGGKRFIPVEIDKHNYIFDPNRIFTDKGVEKHLKLMYRTTKASYALEIKKRMKEFRKNLIEHLDWSETKYLISLHSNMKDSDFSVEDFTNKKKYQLFRNPEENSKNFFFVTRERDFIHLSKLGFNTVYQKSIDDDGSLSIYAHYRKFPYINIEVVEGDEDSQKKMLDAAVEHIITSNTTGGSK